MSDKLPAMQFYPADWRKDPGVQCLSFEDRGIWFEIICLMHESPRRGYLLMPNGSPMMTTSLARIIGHPLGMSNTHLSTFIEGHERRSVDRTSSPMQIREMGLGHQVLPHCGSRMECEQ